MMKRYGYVRVSSKEQNIARQVDAMEDIGLTRKQMYIDRQSGKNFDRINYQRMLRNIRPGDEVYIKSIDRLGRDYDEIMEQWRVITKEKDADIIVLDLPLLDTRCRIHDVTGKFIADLVLQILSYVAQVERENTHQRQAEGIRSAKERGVKFGRPKKLFPDDFEKVYGLYKYENLSKRESAKKLSTNHITFSSLVDRYEKQNLL